MSGPVRSEAEALLAALTAPSPPGSALATVVGVRGSAYRREGARMVVPAEGDPVGTISGGCLEIEVIDAARRVGADGRPCLLRLDVGAQGEEVWGWGTGCPGAIEVFVEPLENAALLVVAMTTARRDRRDVAVVTMVETTAPTDQPGRRTVVHHDGSREGSLGDDTLDALARRAAADALVSGRSATVELAGGRAFVEVLEPPVHLLVCGAGADTKPLVEFGVRLGWLVDKVDHRDARLPVHQIPGAGRRSCAVVMSHNFAHDLDYLASLVVADVGYIGVLGPRARRQRLLDELGRRGIVVDADVLARLHGPAGLPIGAEGPEEIAWAIVAEILSHTRASR